ncbi:MAG: TolC family protein [Gemmatimonadota bacterium]
MPADTLAVDLSEARRIALERNPGFLGEGQLVGVAAGGVRGARTYPLNPEAEAELPGAPGGGGFQGYEVLLVQGVEWAGQRGLRIDAAESGLAGANATLGDARRRLVSAVSEAFYESWAADRRLEVVTEIQALNERLGTAARTQLLEGEISVMESNFAEIEVARSRARVLAAQRAATSARLTLGRLLGIPPQTVVLAREEPELPLPAPATLHMEALLAAAVTQRPDLAAADHAVSQAETLTRLTRRSAIPDLGVGALIQGGEEGESTRVGLQLSVPLPVWNRNQGAVAQHESETRRAALERDAIALTIRTEVFDAYNGYVTASEEEVLFAEQVLTPARQNQILLEAAYREGEIDLPSLILLRNQLLDAEVGFWDAWLARRLNFTQLDAAVGGIGID